MRPNSVYFMYFIVYLPTNLVMKFETNKKMSENFEALQLREYYEKLTKKEKSDFLKYLLVEFDYSYNSIQQKMTGKADMNKRDCILIGSVVEDEKWRNDA